MRDSKEGTEFAITESFFEQLRLDFRTEFPLMFDMLHSLFPTDAGEHSRHKELSAVHALCLLMSLKNPYAKNDVKLLFSILLMSYGVGCQLMNMLCRMGLTLSWQTLDNFLVKQMEENDMKFKTMTPVDIPVLILMDNINMYRGAKKYVRLFKVFGPTMWNFTGRGIMLPNIDKIKPFFEDKSTAVDSQRDVLTMECDDILIDSNTEHSALWDSWLNYYLLCLIDEGLNTLVTDKALNSMTESEINKWLSEKRFENRKGEFIINLGSPEKLMKDDSLGSGASKMFVLPLSLENNATTTGTAAILKEFADKLQIPCEETREFLPFDEQSQTFSVKKAREHSDFLHMIQEHSEEMKEFEKLLVETEKTLEPRAANADVPDNDSADGHANATNDQISDLFENLDLEEFDDIYTDSSSVPSTTLEGKKKLSSKKKTRFSGAFLIIFRIPCGKWLHRENCICFCNRYQLN